MIGDRTNTVDPITFEVLRHRLWAINDEQALMTARISGSPVVYEAKDFNAAILTADGDGLFVGVYVTALAASIDIIVRNVVELFRDDVRDGDIFLTNDPWYGALHQNDLTMAQPVFHEGQLLCWIGLTLHEVDVGGPVPGSISVGARDVYSEGPLIPPIRVGEGGHLRPDLEAMIVRNTRTPALNALNLRARLAAQTLAKRRIIELVEKYGVATFLAVQRQIVDYVRGILQKRLAELPDGTWRDHVLIDHDGQNAAFYELKLALTKRHNKLILDFRGTSAQAPGIVNCTVAGLQGGITNSLFPLLCYDVPWCTAALKQCIEVISEAGTVNNAMHPAPVSMATISATWATGNLVNACVAKMMAASENYRDELQAPWYPGWNGLVISGHDRRNKPLTAMIMNSGGGGGGARSYRDGIDTGGSRTALGMTMPNVEANERLYPFLEVYRKQRPDTYGHGKYRGGIGLEYMLIPHKNSTPLGLVVFLHGGMHPGAPGVYGGYPSSVQGNLIFRETNISTIFKAGRIPTDWEEVAARSKEVLASKDRNQIDGSDAYVSFLAGGGGYGDPLTRDPMLVLRDIENHLSTPAIAERTYGVVITDGRRVDDLATQTKRARIRRERLRRSAPVAVCLGAAKGKGEDAEWNVEEAVALFRIGEHLQVVKAGGEHRILCSECHHVFGVMTEDPKLGALVAERQIDCASSLNVYGASGEIVLREYCCPGCGTLLSVLVQRRGDPVIVETELAPLSDEFERSVV